MDVEKIFWDDPYLTELTAMVTSVNGNLVTLDRTIVFAFSGGQESDRGSISGREILRAEKTDKQIVYTLSEDHGLRVGDQVRLTIDWTRRYKIMRLHFAAELVLELVTRHFDGPEKIGAHIGEDKARVDFLWQGNISQTFEFLQQEIGRLVDADLPVRSQFADREREVRYWEIEGFAKVLCGGTHIRKTGELGIIALKRNNIGKGKERIEITLAD